MEVSYTLWMMAGATHYILATVTQSGTNHLPATLRSETNPTSPPFRKRHPWRNRALQMPSKSRRNNRQTSRKTRSKTNLKANQSKRTNQVVGSSQAEQTITWWTTRSSTWLKLLPRLIMRGKKMIRARSRKAHIGSLIKGKRRRWSKRKPRHLKSQTGRHSWTRPVI